MDEMHHRIMVVEDDETIALGLTHALDHAGFAVRHFDRGEAALDALNAWPPDLIILDIMLPGIDGIEVLKQVKSHSLDLPVILLTAKGNEADRVEGLNAGADDYVPKPFSVRELIARVRARLRAAPATRPTPDRYEFGGMIADLRRRTLIRDGKEERLTTHEAGVLAYLITMRGRDVPREELLEQVWGYSRSMQTRTVDNQVLKLRKKIERVPNAPRHIITVHGVGYRFES